MKYFISDLHVFHKNIIHLQDRPFKSVEEMNEALIENWNKYIAKGDVVYVIGDFSFGKYDETKAIVEKLNGVKVLIRGNHDSRFTTGTFIKLGFSDVYDNLLLKISGVGKVVLSHYPYHPPWYKQLWERIRRSGYKRWYTQFRLNDYGTPLIHGHNHSGALSYKTAKGTTCINVAWDISKRPISEVEIANLLKKK